MKELMLSLYILAMSCGSKVLVEEQIPCSEDGGAGGDTFSTTAGSGGILSTSSDTESTTSTSTTEFECFYCSDIIEGKVSKPGQGNWSYCYHGSQYLWAPIINGFCPHFEEQEFPCGMQCFVSICVDDPSQSPGLVPECVSCLNSDWVLEELEEKGFYEAKEAIVNCKSDG